MSEMVSSLARLSEGADEVVRILDELGLEPGVVRILGSGSHWNGHTDRRDEDGRPYVFMYPIAVEFDSLWAELVDEAAGLIMEAFGDLLTVIRVNGEIFFEGLVGADDIAFVISLGAGTCERVQVGTKVEKQRDPKAVAAALALIPEVDVEVPVFEVRCSDPIVAAGLAPEGAGQS